MKKEANAERSEPDWQTPNAECSKLRTQSPIAAAIADYHRHGSRKFKAHLMDHLVNGYVFSTPSLFVMCKAVAFDDNRVGWYITYARGELRALLSLVPFPLPFIAFRSHDRPAPRIWPFDRFSQLVTGSLMTDHFS